METSASFEARSAPSSYPTIWANDTLASSQAQPLQAMATFAANNSDFSPATAKQMPNDLTLQTAAAANWRHA